MKIFGIRIDEKTVLMASLDLFVFGVTYWISTVILGLEEIEKGVYITFVLFPYLYHANLGMKRATKMIRNLLFVIRKHKGIKMNEYEKMLVEEASKEVDEK